MTPEINALRSLPLDKRLECAADRLWIGAENVQFLFRLNDQQLTELLAELLAWYGGQRVSLQEFRLVRKEKRRGGGW